MLLQIIVVNCCCKKIMSSAFVGVVYLFIAIIYSGFGCCGRDLTDVVVMVGIQDAELQVSEGQSVEICAVIDFESGFFPLSIFPLALTIQLEYITANDADLAPSPPSVLSLIAIPRPQCVHIVTLVNNDGTAFAETFAVHLLSSDHVVLTRSQTVVTIIEPPLLYVPPFLEVFEGIHIVLCVSVEFPAQSPQELLTIDLSSIDISTTSDDYQEEVFPATLTLSITNNTHCLLIPTFINDDGPHTFSETFEVRVVPRDAFQVPGEDQSSAHAGVLTVMVNIVEQCRPGDMILVGGKQMTQGRVEVCSHGLYNTVCASGWTPQNTKVVCMQLDFYSGTGIRAEVGGGFGKGIGPTLSSVISCTGYETDLLSCTITDDSKEANCSHVGVYCSAEHRTGAEFTQYTNPEITVADPDVTVTKHTDSPVRLETTEDTVILGQPEITTHAEVTEPANTTEPRPLQDDDISGRCVKGDSLPLLGGTSPYEGLVEICLGVWYFPIDVDSFTVREASVLCRQTGLGSTGYPLSGTDDLGLDLSPYLELKKNMSGRVECTGDEDSIAECEVSWANTSLRDFAGVKCTQAVVCSDGDIRVVPPSSPASPLVREGRVELCLKGVWGAIFDMEWSALDAAVTCHQLGFDTRGALPIVPAVYPGDTTPLPIVYDSPACDSLSSPSLLACPRVPAVCPGASNLGPSDVERGSGSGSESILGRLTSGAQIGMKALTGVVGVRCEDYSQTGCQDLAVRLTHRERSTAAGNLEVCFGDRWNIVCSDLFDQEDLTVVCRALGFTAYEGNVAEPHFLPASVLTSGTTFGHAVNCSGAERELSECHLEMSPPRDGNGCVNTRIECLAPPRIYFSPLLLNSNVLYVEVNRRASLRCEVDEASYPPVTNLIALSNPSPQLRGGSLAGNRDFCWSASLYRTENASRDDSSQYSCTALSGGRLTTSTARVIVQEPDFVAIRHPEYLRFSAFNSLLPNSIEHLVFNSISANFPGQQKVQCQLVSSRRPEEVESGMDRFECVIYNFGPSSEERSVINRSFSVAEATAAVLQRVHPAIVFTTTSDSGFCDFNMTEELGSVYQWPESRGGDTVHMACPASAYVLSRTCSTEGWLEVDITACQVVLISITQVLTDMVSEDEYEDQVELVADVLQETVTSKTQQSDAVLDVVATFFDAVANVTTSAPNLTIPTQVIEGLVDGLSSLQQWSPDIAFGSGSTSRIIMAFESTAAQFSQQMQVDSVNVTIPDQIIFVAENTAVDLLQQTGRTSVLGDNTVISSGKANNSSLTGNETALISLPSNLFASIDQPTVGIFFALYATPTLFPVRSSSGDNETAGRGVVFSPVLAATVGSGLAFNNVTPPVLIHLRLTGLADSESLHVPGSETCVSWDFQAAEGEGNWSTDGCSKVSVDGDIVTCQCSHLTNFAIIVDICSRVDKECVESVTLDRILSHITYIGVALSLFGLFSTVITMLLFKKLRRREATKYHVQLCVAILCMLLVFVAGVEETDVYVACMAVSALLHYFTLAAVLWMSAEAILMFKKLIFVFERTTKKFILTVSLLCWSIPLVFVLIPLAIDLALGSDPSSDLVISRDEFCFLSNPVVFWTSFLGPIFLVLLINLILYVGVCVVLLKHTRTTMTRRHQPMSFKTAFRLMASIVSIMFLFGVSWLCAALTITVPHLRYIAQVLFAVFNSLQGFFLFLFFCVLNLEARESWKEVLSCGRYKSKILHPSDLGGHHRASLGPSAALGTRVLDGFSSFKGSCRSTLSTLYPLQKHHSSATASHSSIRTIDTPTFDTTDTPTFDTTDTPTFTDTDIPTVTSEEVGVTGHHVEGTGQYEAPGKPLKARVNRFSTMEQHVEEYQVDFLDSSEDEKEHTI